MRTHKILVNRTPEQPKGVEIEVIEPVSDLEEKVLSFLLAATLREIQRSGNLGYTLPEHFGVEYSKDGSFLVKKPAGLSSKGLYEAARPVAVLGLRVQERGLDIVHAPVPAPKPGPTLQIDPVSTPATPENTDAPKKPE